MAMPRTLQRAQLQRAARHASTGSAPHVAGGSAQPEWSDGFAPLQREHRLSAADAAALGAFAAGAGRALAVVTGAGLSTASGIPCYRGERGSYSLGHKPMQHQEFVAGGFHQKRYWARSLRGWRYFSEREPNRAHAALAAMERSDLVSGLVTQNVDRLHQQAGSTNVVDLHGRNDRCICLECRRVEARPSFQGRVERANAGWMRKFSISAAEWGAADIRADGDAEIGDADYRAFAVPPCLECSGVMMPDLTFFGGNIEQSVKDAASQIIADATRVLILGSTMQTFSAVRMARQAKAEGKEIAIVTVGESRVDELCDLRVEARVDDALDAICDHLDIAYQERP